METFNIGDRVKVIRGGIQTTGMIGTVTKIVDKQHVRVHFIGNKKNTYNTLSLEKIYSERDNMKLEFVDELATNCNGSNYSNYSNWVTTTTTDNWNYSSSCIGNLCQSAEMAITTDAEERKKKEVREKMNMGKHNIVEVDFNKVNVHSNYRTTGKYYAYYDLKLSEDDMIVVRNPQGFSVAKVIKVIEKNEVTEQMRNYIEYGYEVVDLVSTCSYEERVENRKAAKELKIEMDRKMKEMQEITLYEMMAEKCPELKQMLDSYKELMEI